VGRVGTEADTHSYLLQVVRGRIAEAVGCAGAGLAEGIVEDAVSAEFAAGGVCGQGEGGED
jgi:hypothetical protein